MFPLLKKFQASFHSLYPHVQHKMVDCLAAQPLSQCSHMLFYGPCGGLKQEYVYEFIRNHYQIDGFQCTYQTLPLTINSVTYDVSMHSCNYFLQFNPSEHSAYDKHVIADIIKPIVEQPNVFYPRHIVVINNIDQLSSYALMFLRRMIEVLFKEALFIFTANSISSIPDPIKSRCSLIRCPLLTSAQIMQIYHTLETPDDYLEPSILENLINISERNIYNFLIATYTYAITKDINKCALSWETDIKEFFDAIKKTRSSYTAYVKIREFCFKIIHYNEKHASIFNSILKALASKHGADNAKMTKYVSILANADALLSSCTRVNFVYEQMLLQIYGVS